MTASAPPSCGALVFVSVEYNTLRVESNMPRHLTERLAHRDC